MIPLLAEVEATNWVALASTLSSTGFAVWYAWYMTTKRMPEIERIAAERTNLLMENYRQDIRYLWDQKAKGDERLTNALDKLCDRIERIPCQIPVRGNHNHN